MDQTHPRNIPITGHTMLVSLINSYCLTTLTLFIILLKFDLVHLVMWTYIIQCWLWSNCLSLHYLLKQFYLNICVISVFDMGIKHGFSYTNIRQVPWEVLKTEAKGRGFQHLPRDLANVNALKNHIWSLLLHKKLKTFATFRVISCTILLRLFTDVLRT